MSTENYEKLEKSINNMKEKLSRIYFMVQDTKGNAKASVRYIYQMAIALKKEGYNSIILHEKPDYFGVSSWLGEEYMSDLEHRSIDGTSLEISPDDLIIIPEIYGFVMDQITKLPCGKIVLSQAFDNIFETIDNCFYSISDQCLQIIDGCISFNNSRLDLYSELFIIPNEYEC